MLGIAVGAFIAGVVVTYATSALMLRPVHAQEAKILSERRGPNEVELAWGLLNARAELVMIRGTLTVLAGLVTALVAIQMI